MSQTQPNPPRLGSLAAGTNGEKGDDMRRGEVIANQIVHEVRTDDGVWLCTFAVCGQGVSISSNCDGGMPWSEAERLRDWLDAMLKDDTNDKENR